MYKKFVIALAVGALAIALHYLVQAGANTVIGDAYANDAHTNINPPTTESVLGSYVCNKSSGCKDEYVLSLKDDQVFELVLTPSQDATTSDESVAVDSVPKQTLKGTWALSSAGIILVTITNQDETTLDTPEKITIRKVDADKLSRFYFNKTTKLAKGMANPSFSRQN